MKAAELRDLGPDELGAKERDLARIKTVLRQKRQA